MPYLHCLVLDGCGSSRLLLHTCQAAFCTFQLVLQVLHLGLSGGCSLITAPHLLLQLLYLTLEGLQPVRAQVLITQFWPEAPWGMGLVVMIQVHI